MNFILSDVRLKHLIACNNAKVKVKDFSGCVTGVIITAFVHHILDLAAFLWCTHRKFILSCYIRRLFLCGIGMWEIWVVFGMRDVNVTVTSSFVSRRFLHCILSFKNRIFLFRLWFFAIIPKPYSHVKGVFKTVRISQIHKLRKVV